jgi:flagellar assembly protein FliH
MMIMSDRGAVRAVALTDLAAGTGAFACDRRFAVPVEADAAAAPDPLEQAWARGYAEGAEAARSAAEAAAAADDAARHRIETALAQMDEAQTRAFAARLQDTVLALCGGVLDQAAIDPQALMQRVERAVAMFNRANDERTIRLHPEDLALIHARLPADWHCLADAALERGMVRVETADGGVEDGPAQWRAALEEALRAW